MNCFYWCPTEQVKSEKAFNISTYNLEFLIFFSSIFSALSDPYEAVYCLYEK